MPPARWLVPAALLLAGVIALLREVSWINLRARDVTWRVDFGAVPVVGDLISAGLVVLVGLLVLSVLWPRRWVAWALLVTAVIVVATSALAVVTAALVERAAGSVLGRLGWDRSAATVD